jgi:hypothetical protein
MPAALVVVRVITGGWHPRRVAVPLARQAFASILVAERPCNTAGRYFLPFSINLLFPPAAFS